MRKNWPGGVSGSNSCGDCGFAINTSVTDILAPPDTCVNREERREASRVWRRCSFEGCCDLRSCGDCGFAINTSVTDILAPPDTCVNREERREASRVWRRCSFEGCCDL